jgi:CheY-like chemotaxis protein/HPt (histidine-containing phosphotransfer) domain-containing protein
VESVPGVGSTFRFDVLLTLPRGEAAQPGAAVAAAAGLQGRVLIAEDNATNRLVATRMLERMGHRVEAVENGREAVAAVQRGGFDLVLMDVMMPEMDGIAATRAIRRLGGEAGRIPIIGLTANAMADERERCLEAGMTHFESKPISADRLSAAIVRVLQAARDAQAPARGPAPEPPAAEGAGAAVARAMAPSPGFDPALLEALARDIGDEAARDVVRQFVADAPRQMDDMRDLAGSGRMDLLAHQARLVARAARAVGLTGLAGAAMGVHDDAAAGRYEGLAARVEAMAPQVEAGLEALRRWQAVA